MNRAWWRFAEMQHSWGTRERELVDRIDKLEAEATEAKKALVES